MFSSLAKHLKYSCSPCSGCTIIIFHYEAIIIGIITLLVLETRADIILHNKALIYLAAREKGVSFVDCTAYSLIFFPKNYTHPKGAPCVGS